MKLSDEDVERIAEAVALKMSGRKVEIHQYINAPANIPVPRYPLYPQVWC